MKSKRVKVWGLSHFSHTAEYMSDVFCSGRMTYTAEVLDRVTGASHKKTFRSKEAAVGWAVLKMNLGVLQSS